MSAALENSCRARIPFSKSLLRFLQDLARQDRHELGSAFRILAYLKTTKSIRKGSTLLLPS